jgi:hypothetical protein
MQERHRSQSLPVNLEMPEKEICQIPGVNALRALPCSLGFCSTGQTLDMGKGGSKMIGKELQQRPCCLSPRSSSSQSHPGAAWELQLYSIGYGITNVNQQ